jgi:hypothetical protein
MQDEHLEGRLGLQIGKTKKKENSAVTRCPRRIYGVLAAAPATLRLRLPAPTRKKEEVRRHKARRWEVGVTWRHTGVDLRRPARTWIWGGSSYSNARYLGESSERLVLTADPDAVMVVVVVRADAPPFGCRWSSTGSRRSGAPRRRQVDTGVAPLPCRAAPAAPGREKIWKQGMNMWTAVGNKTWSMETLSGGELPKENLDVTAPRKRSRMNCGGEKILKEDLNCSGSILKEEKQARNAMECGGSQWNASKERSEMQARNVVEKILKEEKQARNCRGEKISGDLKCCGGLDRTWDFRTKRGG